MFARYEREKKTEDWTFAAFSFRRALREEWLKRKRKRNEQYERQSSTLRSSINLCPRVYGGRRCLLSHTAIQQKSLSQAQFALYGYHFLALCSV
jgi:hypothetical protein